MSRYRIAAVVVALGALGALSACDTDAKPSPHPTPTTSSSPRPLTLPSAKAPTTTEAPIQVPMFLGTALAPDGWGRVAPTRAQAVSMSAWLQKYIESGAGLLGTVMTKVDAMNTAADRGDIRSAKTDCDDISQQLSSRIPKALPAPDPDMTSALQAVMDAGRVLTEKCAVINGSGRAGALEAVDAAVGRLGATLTVVGDIVRRDSTVITTANAKR